MSEPFLDPAAWVIERAGSVPALARAIGYAEVSIYRWRKPRSVGGTDGFIPSRAQRAILAAADRGDLKILPQDLHFVRPGRGI